MLGKEGFVDGWDIGNRLFINTCIRRAQVVLSLGKKFAVSSPLFPQLSNQEQQSRDLSNQEVLPFCLSGSSTPAYK